MLIEDWPSSQVFPLYTSVPDRVQPLVFKLENKVGQGHTRAKQYERNTRPRFSAVGQTCTTSDGLLFIPRLLITDRSNIDSSLRKSP